MDSHTTLVAATLNEFGPIDLQHYADILCDFPTTGKALSPDRLRLETGCVVYTDHGQPSIVPWAHVCGWYPVELQGVRPRQIVDSITDGRRDAIKNILSELEAILSDDAQVAVLRGDFFHETPGHHPNHPGVVVYVDLTWCVVSQPEMAAHP